MTAFCSRGFAGAGTMAAGFLLLSVPSQVTAEEQSVMRGAIENLRTYGHRAGPEEPVELVNLRVVARAESEGERIAAVAAPQAKGLGDSRQAYFGKAGWCDTPILGPGDLVSDVAGLVRGASTPKVALSCCGPRTRSRSSGPALQADSQ